MRVENNLGWSTNIANLERKLRHRLFNLRKLSEHLPRNLLKQVADGIFMSVVRYGLPLYCPVRLKNDEPHHGSIDKIKVVFNDCLRLLTNKRSQDRARIEDMLVELGWISINQLCAETRLIEAWKTVHSDDYCMKDMLKPKKKPVKISTRSAYQNLLETGERDKFENGSFIYKTAQIWNKAP